MKRWPELFLMWTLAMLAACSTVPPQTAIKYPLSIRPNPPATAENNGAIFQPAITASRSTGALFEDRRARQVGDTLTVNLVEDTSSTRTSNTTDERKVNGNIDIPSPVILGQGRGIGATIWAPNASNKMEFKDSVVNSNTITGAITVTVIDVLANGNLLVTGEKQVAINGDTEFIRIAGVVNPNQISASNSVNSTQLADVQFESKNSTSLDTAQMASALARFFLTVVPF